MWQDFTTRILKNLVGKKLESSARVYANLPCLGEGLASFHLSVETIYGIHHATQLELGSFTFDFERVGCSFLSLPRAYFNGPSLGTLVGIPLMFWKDKVLEFIGNRIGKFVKLEKDWNIKTDKRWAYLLVKVDLGEGLLEEMELINGSFS